MLLTTSNMNDGNGFRIHGIWNPYEKPDLMFVILYYICAFFGGVTAILVVNLRFRPRNLVFYSKVFVCILMVSNFSLVFSESVQILLYRVLLIQFFRERLTFYYTSMVDSSCFLITYTISFIIAYAIVYNIKQNWDRTTYDIVPIKELIICELQTKLKDLDISIELNTTHSTKDFRESMVIDDFINTSEYNANVRSPIKTQILQHSPDNSSKEDVKTLELSIYDDNNIRLEEIARRQQLSQLSLSYGVSVKDIYKAILALGGNDILFDSVDNFNNYSSQPTKGQFIHQSKASIDEQIIEDSSEKGSNDQNNSNN